jgi:predicted transcriptional regulator
VAKSPPRPADAALPSVDSTEALVRLLTPDNRSLLRTIRDAKPQSVAELARLTNRAESNLLRTLGKLEAFGLLEMQTIAPPRADDDYRKATSRYRPVRYERQDRNQSGIVSL